jgi:spore maturation protein CgeB
LRALEAFDHVVVGYRDSVKPLSDALGRTCHHLPIAVDAMRFTPLARHEQRVVDILSIGRRRHEVHGACKDLARNDRLFYVYDTINASYADVVDHREHREMLATMARRSRYFVVAPAKIDAIEGTRGQVEVGLRYYEAAAAGAVLAGQAPVCESFRSNFDWPDSVIEVKADGSDLADVLRKLISDPARESEISTRNAVQALLRHDWVYRWERILEIVGLQPSPRLLERKAHLRTLAQSAVSGNGEGDSRRADSIHPSGRAAESDGRAVGRQEL